MNNNRGSFTSLLEFSISALTHAEEVRLANLVLAGSSTALDRLLRSQLRLVFWIAREFEPFGLSKDDVLSEGLLGLTEAARRFDPSRGFRFASYARYWIHAYMRRYTLENRRITRTPTSRNGRKLLSSFSKTQRRIANLTGQWPDLDAVAEALGMPLRDVEEFALAIGSSDVPIGPDVEHGEVELQSDAESIDEVAVGSEERDQAARTVKAAFDALSPRERTIVQHRFLDDDALALATIGELLGLSRERVRQLENKALEKIRDAVVGKRVGRIQRRRRRISRMRRAS